MIEQQYYTSSEIGGYMGRTGHTTIAFSAGLSDAEISRIDTYLNAYQGANEHGGKTFRYMYSDGNFIILGESSPIMTGRSTYFIHNYIVPAGSDEWIQLAKNVHCITDVSFVAPFLHTQQIPTLPQLAEIPVADRKDSDASITDELARAGVDKASFQSLIGDIMEQLNERIAGRQHGVISVVLGGNEDEQTIRAKTLLRCILKCLPYGARRFLGFSYLYRGGALTPNCVLLIVENSKNGVQSQVSQRVYDFTCSSYAAGVKNPAGCYQTYLNAVIDRPSVLSELFEEMEQITSIANCHLQAKDTCVIAMLISHMYATGNKLVPISSEVYENTLRSGGEWAGELGARGSRVLLNVFKSYLSDCIRFGARPNIEVMNFCADFFRHSFGDEFMAEIAGLLEQINEFSGVPRCVAEWAASLDCSRAFFAELATGNSKFMQNYISVGLSSCRDFDSLMTRSGNMMRSAVNEAMKASVAGSIRNQAIRIFSELSEKERIQTMLYLDDASSSSDEAAGVIFGSLLDKFYYRAGIEPADVFSVDEMYTLSRLSNRHRVKTDPSGSNELINLLSELTSWHKGKAVNETELFARLSSPACEHDMGAAVRWADRLIGSAMEKTFVDSRTYELLWLRHGGFAMPRNLTRERFRMMLNHISRWPDRNMLKFLRWVIDEKAAPPKKGGAITKLFGKKEEAGSDEGYLRLYKCCLAGTIDFINSKSAVYAKEKDTRKIVEAVGCDAFCEEHARFAEAVKKLFR